MPFLKEILDIPSSEMDYSFGGPQLFLGNWSVGRGSSRSAAEPIADSTSIGVATFNSPPRLSSTTSVTGHGIGEATLVFLVAGLLMGVDCTELGMLSSFPGVHGFARIWPPPWSAHGLPFCSATGPVRGTPGFFWGVATIDLPLTSAPKSAKSAQKT